MIEISNLSKEKPYKFFEGYYEKAFKAKQRSIEAISISSFNKMLNEVESRYVNLKYIIGNEWTFFSNYRSPKAKDFQSHDQISALLYWGSINVQIRLKANIYMSSEDFSDKHFLLRSKEKNALAISSSQSELVESYSEVEKSFNNVLSQISEDTQRPDFWGGFTFVPYYFEFWEGHENRLNKRHVFKLNEENWEEWFLQP